MNSYFTLSINKLNRMLTKVVDLQLEHLEISMSQLVTLQLVAKLSPARIIDLASELQLDRTTVRRNLEILIDKGLIIVGPNVRQGFTLTDKAKQLLPIATKALDDADRKVSRMWVDANMHVLEFLCGEPKSEMAKLLLPDEQLKRNVELFLPMLEEIC